MLDKFKVLTHLKTLNKAEKYVGKHCVSTDSDDHQHTFLEINLS